ncbi:MAG: putative metalloprotease CJM1_0395 family protein [Stappiaceae bacterium]
MIGSLAAGPVGLYSSAQGGDSRNGANGDAVRSDQTNAPVSKNAQTNESNARSVNAVQPVPSGAPAQNGGSGKSQNGEELSEEEKRQVEKLKARDREVRAHELAHARVGGPYAGAPSYTFQQGPDGKRYAIGGEVSIDSSAESTPEETVRKMEVVIRAALAPAEPSSQDRRVAAEARQQLIEAQAQSRKENDEALRGEEEGGPPSALDIAKKASEQAKDKSAGREGDKSEDSPFSERLTEAINAYSQLADSSPQSSSSTDASALFNLIA